MPGEADLEDGTEPNKADPVWENGSLFQPTHPSPIPRLNLSAWSTAHSQNRTLRPRSAGRGGRRPRAFPWGFPEVSRRGHRKAPRRTRKRAALLDDELLAFARFSEDAGGVVSSRSSDQTWTACRWFLPRRSCTNRICASVIVYFLGGEGNSHSMHLPRLCKQPLRWQIIKINVGVARKRAARWVHCATFTSIHTGLGFSRASYRCNYHTLFWLQSARIIHVCHFYTSG